MEHRTATPAQVDDDHAREVGATPSAPGSESGASPGAQQGELIQETVPFTSPTQKLARTGEPFDAGGMLVGAAAVAGAALCVARGFFKDIVSEEDLS